MNELATGTLHAELRALIANSRQRLAGAVNAELTRLYWTVGERLRTEMLGGADRAKYGDQLIQRVWDQLAQEFGRGFEAKNLRRMVQFARAFPQPEIVATLSRQLSWSHFVNLLPLKTEAARQFYASHAATHTWSVRELPVENRLGFPVVALPGVGHMPAKGEDEKEAARVFYVAATRATQRLVMGVGGYGGFGARLGT